MVHSFTPPSDFVAQNPPNGNIESLVSILDELEEREATAPLTRRLFEGGDGFDHRDGCCDGDRRQQKQLLMSPNNLPPPDPALPLPLPMFLPPATINNEMQKIGQIACRNLVDRVDEHRCI
mmetsp:Transcript_3918/g.10263  ORF Transcript_3918/g.10263 Transcript_3918/m.10263 type:complete len:121 (+) Transcript_3918:236-598(+)